MPKKRSDAQKLRTYILGLPTKKDRILALAMLNKYDSSGEPLSEEESEEFDKLVQDVCFPTHVDSNTATLQDVKDFKDTFNVLNEIKIECLNQQKAEQIQWKNYLKKQNPQYTEEELSEQAKLHESLYGEGLNTKLLVDEFSLYMLQDILTDPHLKAITKELKKDPMYEKFYTEKMMKKAAENPNFIMPDSDALKNFDMGLVLFDMGNIEINEKIHPLASEYSQKDFEPAEHPDALSRAGLTDDQAEDHQIWLSYEKYASFGKPWKSPEENSAFKISTYASYRLPHSSSAYTDQELKAKGQMLSALRSHMKTQLKSTFYDSDDYKDMMQALDKIQSHMDQWGEAPKYNARDAFRKDLQQVMKTCGKYVNSHVTNRSTVKGQDRFDAALAAIAIVDASVAHAIGDEINHVRETDKKPQLMDIKKLAEKFNLKGLDDEKKYQMAAKRKAIQTAGTGSINQILNREAVQIKLKCLMKIFGNDEESIKKAVGELKSAGVNCHLKNQDKPERAAWNVIGYYTYKHPEARGLTIEEISKQPDFKNAFEDYKQFLQDNAIEKPDEKNPDKKVPLPKDQVEKGLKNLAEYHNYMFTAVLNDNVFPDLTDPKQINASFGKNYDLYLGGINIAQNCEGLITHQDPSFFDYYPGNAEQYHKDITTFNAVTRLAQSAFIVNNQTEALQKRLGARLLLLDTKDLVTGKTPSQLAGDPEFAKRVLGGGITYNMAAIDFLDQYPDQKAACEAYLNGKANMPEKLSGFLQINRKDYEQDMNQRYGVYCENKKNMVISYQKSKEKPHVTTHNFQELEKNFLSKSVNHAHRPKSSGENKVESNNLSKSVHLPKKGK